MPRLSDMPHFLMVYDRGAGQILELTEFEEDQRDEAMAERDAREEAELENADIEVVLFGAESEAALRKTHARYFDLAGEIASRKA